MMWLPGRSATWALSLENLRDSGVYALANIGSFFAGTRLAN
jgi:hypothetical protein